MMADAKLRAWIRRRLLGWFDENARDLPWRGNRDPFAIWVSEVMLQQTLVATVVPFFKRFLSHFPTIEALACAGEQEVLRLWSGLGYYARVRNLHRAAKIIAAEHDSNFPDDIRVVSGLPGFGRYTTAAVLSQAFDRRLPILEANSLRVLCRLFAIDDDAGAAATRKRLWDLSAALLPRNRCGDFNQALMELGALVCTPATPRCQSCPLRTKCKALQNNQQEMLPVRPPPPAVVRRQEVGVIAFDKKRTLLVQRPQTGRWADMWEFPHDRLQRGKSKEEAASQILKQFTGISACIGRELTTLRHTVTRYRITMACFLAERTRGRFRSDFYRQGKWVELHELMDYPLSSPQRRLANLLATTMKS